MTAVGIDSVGGKAEFLGYLLRALTLGNALQHIQFAQRQFFPLVLVGMFHLGADTFGVRTIISPTLQHPPDGFGDARRIDRLEQNAIYIALYQVFNEPDFWRPRLMSFNRELPAYFAKK